MQLIISIFLVIMPVHAEDDTATDACNDWGTIKQARDVYETVRAGDQKIILEVADATCGAVEECVWTIIGGNANQRAGSWYDCDNGEPNGAPIEDAEGRTVEVVSSESGEVCFIPAETLYQCRPFKFQISLECPAIDGESAPDIDFVSGVEGQIDIKDVSLDCTVDASVTGGGCISAQGSGVVTASVWLLFPFFGIGAWVRRRDD